ncbi:MAG: hypothetical protein ICV83_26120 [Cytophagales bacterium]|nr:hypothetical protein [Cytophagales bacterium]
MKKWHQVPGLIIIDFILIWFWVKEMDPDPSSSLVMILLAPFVFGLNIIAVGLLCLVKQKQYIDVFLINSLISPVIMFYLFGQGVKRYQPERLESWKFTSAATTFEVTRWKKTGAFIMSYSTNPGSSSSFLDGKYEWKDGAFILTTDSTRYILKDNFLVGFPSATDSIRLKPVE